MSDRQQWEYRFIRNMAPDKVDQTLESSGRHSWELVSFWFEEGGYSYPLSYNAVFKRSRE